MACTAGANATRSPTASAPSRTHSTSWAGTSSAGARSTSSTSPTGVYRLRRQARLDGLYCAISGLEQALWDIAGKATGQPVYNLLGGACRDEAPRLRQRLGEATASPTWWRSRRAPWSPAASPRSSSIRSPAPGARTSIAQTRTARVARVRAVREAVGPDVEILVEVHRRLGPQHAIRVARRLEACRPFWFEEPVSARDLGGLIEVKRDIALPVVTGEELYTKVEFHEVIARRAADILNPDVCNCGGILELREIAAMAEPAHIAVSPHNYNSTTLGLAATLHAAAAMPNFLITEYFVNFEAAGRAIARPPFAVEQSYIALPTAPGPRHRPRRSDALARHPSARPRCAASASPRTSSRARRPSGPVAVAMRDGPTGMMV